MSLFYLDSSAVVKLIRAERETATLKTFIDDADLISSALVLTEVPRAVRRASASEPHLPLDELIAHAGDLIDALALVPLDGALLTVAGALDEPTLRSLDAIHVAAAASVSPITAFVSYDERQSAAARLAGLRTAAPGG
ncbi:MAG: type II toxin-antitoxin system VapC family toxin [Thermoleophilia bacterium]|nr:type II toxin-antitoxin system VapC family toxin [Thermoleophilia bacterium]